MQECSQEQAFRVLQQVHEAEGFEAAFHRATGLRVTLWPLPADGVGLLALDNPVCRRVVETAEGQAVCQRRQEELRRALEAGRSVERFCCVAGMTVLAVPVRLCGEPAAMLHTNRLLLRRPGREELEAASAQLRAWGVEVSADRLAGMLSELVVLEAAQLDAVVRLLRIYADHLGDVASRRILADRHGKPCALAQALAYIKEHHGERLPLGEVARRVGLSPYYFCKLFHRTMGMTFTQYLNRVRLERAKDLLLNPALPVAEVASAVGFGSIPHFNRSFKRYTGMTPTAYRAMRVGRGRLPIAAG